MSKKEFSHYYIKVSGYDYIDIYRILELYHVTNNAIGHAIKKLMVAGNRGSKDVDKDINEAIVTLKRYLEMKKEDEDIIALNSTINRIEKIKTETEDLKTKDVTFETLSHFDEAIK